MDCKTATSNLIDEYTVKAINSVLAKGDRVEVIPVKDGVRVIHIKRKEVKPDDHIRSSTKNAEA